MDKVGSRYVTVQVDFAAVWDRQCGDNGAFSPELPLPCPMVTHGFALDSEKWYARAGSGKDGVRECLMGHKVSRFYSGSHFC